MTDTATDQRATLPLNLLVPNPDNIRTDMDADSIVELAESIVAVGLLNAITVTPRPDGTYMVIAGHRRLCALQFLVDERRIPHTWPAPVRVIDTISADYLTAIMLVENLQRADISPVDEARGYMRLVSDHGYTLTRLASVVGRSAAHVSDRIALLSLPADVLGKVGDSLPIGAAVAITKITDDKKRTELVKLAGKGQLRDWNIESALRSQNHKDRIAKLKEAVAAKNLTYSTSWDELGYRFNDLDMVEQFDTAEDIEGYIPGEGHVCLFTDRSFSVYRVLSEQEIADREQRRSVGLRAGEEFTPLHAYKQAKYEYEDVLREWRRERDSQIGPLVLELSTATLKKVALELAADSVLDNSRTAFSVYNIANRVLTLLNLTGEGKGTVDEVRARFLTTTDNCLRMYIAQQWLMGVQSVTLQKMFDERLATVGLVEPPDQPAILLVRPWQDSDGNWITDRPNPADDEHLEAAYDDQYEYDDDDDDFDNGDFDD